MMNQFIKIGLLQLNIVEMIKLKDSDLRKIYHLQEQIDKLHDKLAKNKEHSDYHDECENRDGNPDESVLSNLQAASAALETIIERQ